MNTHRKFLIVLVVSVILLGLGMGLESYLLARQPAMTVTRLMTLPPEDIQLSSPLWDYRTSFIPEWTSQEVSGNLREYIWNGILQTDPEAPGLQVLSGGKELPTLNPDEWEKSTRAGFTYTPSREKMLVKDYFFAADHSQFFVHHLDWENPVLEWEALMIASDTQPISLCLAFDGVWAATVEVSCDDWTAMSLPSNHVTAGTHTLYMRTTGTFSTLEKSLQRQIFVRNVKAKDPATLKVRLPLEEPAPTVRYRPVNPLKTLLAQPEPSLQPLQTKPWSEYDESSLFVRPMEVDDFVRTGVYLPTPAEWRVSLQVEQPSDLLFYPTVRDPSNHQAWGAADLEVVLEAGSTSKTLWHGQVNPQADPNHTAWKQGIRAPLGVSKGERVTLVFRSKSLPGAEAKPQPLILGEPLLVPSQEFPHAPSPNSPKSVILISIDTLRADAVGCIGGGKATPWMDQYFGSEGAVWPNAEAPCSWTLPSHTCLMLSQYPSRHGVIMHYDSIPPNADALAEYFSTHQYETAAFVDREYLNYRFGFYQGFHMFEQIGGHFQHILPRCLEYLRHRDKSVPLFLFLHTYDCHDPYTPSPEYRQRFVREGLKPSTPDLDNPNLQWDILTKASFGLYPLGPDDPEYMHSLYLAEVAYVDDMLRNFFHQLTTEHLIEDPLVVLVSDHGEAFNEHNMWTHGKCLYAEMVRVPILFHFPGQQHSGSRIEQRTTLIDVPPTLFSYLGLEAPSGWQGISLMEPMETPNPQSTARKIYGEWANSTHSVFSLTHEDRRFINTIEDKITNEMTIDRSRKVEAFNLMKDPWETRNLASSELPQATQELDRTGLELARMLEILHADGKIERADLDPAIIRSLQAIGYLQPESNASKEKSTQPVAPAAPTP